MERVELLIKRCYDSQARKRKWRSWVISIGVEMKNIGVEYICLHREGGITGYINRKV
jgi:hypothetical protein